MYVVPRDSETEIRSCVEKMVARLERDAFSELRNAERARDKEALRRERERMRFEQDVEEKVRKCMDFLVKKVEKLHERSTLEDDGRPFVDHR